MLLCPWQESALWRRNNGIGVAWMPVELSQVTTYCPCMYCTQAKWPILKGSILDCFNCNEKDLWEVKLMTEQDR